MNWILCVFVFSAVAIADEVKEGVITPKDCYYCGKGQLGDIIKLTDIYGNAELKVETLAQPFRPFDDDCGKNDNKTLKVIKCPYGCMIAQFLNTGAVISGCARNGMKIYELSSRTYNEQQFQMAVCSNDECNESYESAKNNRAKPTIAPNSTVEPVLEVNGTVNVNGTQIPNETVDKKSTPQPKKKPNSASSIGVSTFAVVFGLLTYAYAF